MFFMIKAAYDGIEYLDRDHIIRVWFVRAKFNISFISSIYLSNGSMVDVGWALHGFLYQHDKHSSREFRHTSSAHLC
jgi:hypothetical protein